LKRKLLTSSIYLAVAVLVIAGAGGGYFYFRGHRDTAINSIAVLPFVM